MTTPDAATPAPDDDRIRRALAAMHLRRARLRRYRIVGVSGVTLTAAIVVLVVAMLSANGRDTLIVTGPPDATSTTAVPSTSSMAVPISRSSVVAIERVPNGENIHPVTFSADSFPAAFQAAIDLLPPTLPSRSGPERCDFGYSVVITVSGGQKFQYGPCTIPEAVNTAIAAAWDVYDPRDAGATLLYWKVVQACRTGAPVGTIFSVGPTTVGELRNPPPHTALPQIANAFPGSPDDAFAALCGRKLDGQDQYYAVGPNDQIAIVGRP